MNWLKYWKSEEKLVTLLRNLKNHHNERPYQTRIIPYYI